MIQRLWLDGRLAERRHHPDRLADAARAGQQQRPRRQDRPSARLCAPDILVGATRHPATLATCAAVVLFGIAIEGLQGLTPARQPDLLDALANSGGVLLGWLAARLLPNLPQRLAARYATLPASRP